MSEEEEINAKKESTMETVDNKPSHYCPHYERDTCLILFKCCNKWYPCHKCHNEAMTSLAEQNEIEPENSGPSPDNETMSVEMADAEVDSFVEAVEVRSGAEEARQEGTSTTGDEADVNIAGGTSDEQRNRQAGACNDENGVRAGTEGHEMDATPFSHSGMREKQSVATAVDGIQAFGQQRENSQRSFDSHCRGDYKFPIEEQESNRPYHLEERDGLEMTSSSEIIDIRNDSRDPQCDLQSIGEVEDTCNVVSGLSDEAGNDESEEDKEENGVEAGSEENDLQVPLNGLPLSADGTGKTHSMATSLDGTLLKCAQCKEEQEFSKECKKCHRPFAKYSCEICKLLIENDVDPYHCPDCGICRANKKDHFHCEVCNVCMSRTIKESHICSYNRGHDPCAICLEEVFTGASTFSCLHIVHKDCAIKLIRSGSLFCPMCRTAILQNGEIKISEIPSTQSLFEKVKTGFCYPFEKLCSLNFPRWLSRNSNSPGIV